MSRVVEVRLWGRTIGALALTGSQNCASFQYDPAFAENGIEVAPFTMPLSRRVYRFPKIAEQCFHGLPGLVADSLPDRFGNALIAARPTTRGLRPQPLNALETLSYTGSRGMGALEFFPADGPRSRKAETISVERLVVTATQALTLRYNLQGAFSSPEKSAALNELLLVGSTTGGRLAKALITWNPANGEIRSGQGRPDKGFEHWLLKFDGIFGVKDKEMENPRDHGAIEYAYAGMAEAAGIRMSPCRLLEENGRRHFMTRRFDRLANGEKLHMQSLSAMTHVNSVRPGAYSYEQTLQTARKLGLPMRDLEELFRRMVFNIVARNQNDHVKNIAFLMDKKGRWSLAPAYNLTFSYQPTGRWTSSHQMTLNNKRDNFRLEDFTACAKTASLKRGKAGALIQEVQETVSRWPDYADAVGVLPAFRDRVLRSLRLQPFS